VDNIDRSVDCHHYRRDGTDPVALHLVTLVPRRPRCNDTHAWRAGRPTNAACSGAHQWLRRPRPSRPAGEEREWAVPPLERSTRRNGGDGPSSADQRWSAPSECPPSGTPGATPAPVAPAAGTAPASEPDGTASTAGAPLPVDVSARPTAEPTDLVTAGPTTPAAEPPATPEATTARRTASLRPRTVNASRPRADPARAAADSRGVARPSRPAASPAAYDPRPVPLDAPRTGTRALGTSTAPWTALCRGESCRRAASPRRTPRPHAPGPSVHTAVIVASALSNARSNVATSLTQRTDTTADFRTAV